MPPSTDRLHSSLMTVQRHSRKDTLIVGILGSSHPLMYFPSTSLRSFRLERSVQQTFKRDISYTFKVSSWWRVTEWFGESVRDRLRGVKGQREDQGYGEFRREGHREGWGQRNGQRKGEGQRQGEGESQNEDDGKRRVRERKRVRERRTIVKAWHKYITSCLLAPLSSPWGGRGPGPRAPRSSSLSSSRIQECIQSSQCARD